MPAGIKNPDLWQKAIEAVGDSDWAAVLSSYKGMGGQADKGIDEACANGSMGQLMRDEEAYNPDQDRDETGKWGSGGGSGSGSGGSKGGADKDSQIKKAKDSLKIAVKVLTGKGNHLGIDQSDAQGMHDAAVAKLGRLGVDTSDLQAPGYEYNGESWKQGAQSFATLREAKVTEGKREVRCILITEGPGNLRDRNYYTEDFIRDAAKKYNGARAYLNHASEADYKSRPEGDVRELCGFYRDTKVVMVRDPKTGESVAAVEGTLVLDESTAGNNALAKVEAQLMYSQIFPESAEEYCGLSISGSGVREGQAEIKGQKWNRIIGVGQADSVDVVTRPARGGAFLALAESAGKAPHLPKEEGIMLKKLMAITAEITEATKKLSEAKTDEGRATVKAEIEKLNAKLTEAAAGVEEAFPPKKDDDEMGALKKLMPKNSDEADDAYDARLAKVKAAAKGKESAAPEIKDGMSADELRKKFPKTFEAVASRVRESEAEKGTDITKVKAELREAKTELQVLKDKELAGTLLSEAGVPVKLLSVGDLLGMSESEMKREIEKVQAIVEAAGGRVAIPAGAKGGKGQSNKLADALKTLKQDAGV